MAAFNLNQQQTPSQSCTEISVREHANESERENSVASGLSTGQRLQNYTRDASDNKQHNGAHHSQTSEDFCTNRVQNAPLPHLLKADDLSIFWNYGLNDNLKLSMQLKL